MKVRDIKISDIIRTSPETTITEAARLMSNKKIGSVLIEEKGSLIGIVTKGDILRKIVAHGKNTNSIRVKDVMTSPLIKIDEEHGVDDANNLMVKNNLRRLITTKDGKDTGIVTLTDISKNLRFLWTKRILGK